MLNRVNASMVKFLRASCAAAIAAASGGGTAIAMSLRELSCSSCKQGGKSLDGYGFVSYSSQDPFSIEITLTGVHTDPDEPK